ncbi:hypothetical protein AU375_04077 [Methylobacterium radiotolerans]|nr:hypothetical protein AU375_04077 [Methylobacterium radiotolerans]
MTVLVTASLGNRLDAADPKPARQFTVVERVWQDYVRTAVEMGLWAPPTGMTLEDVFANATVRPFGDAFISGEADFEEVTIHSDGTYTSRLT